MNLWANRLGQLTLLSVALFFFSCEDDSSLLGFKNPNSKFQGKYIEIPLTSSTIALDSIRTSNQYFNNEYNRLLVGSWAGAGDTGPVVCNAVTEFWYASLERFPDDYQITNVYVQFQLDHTTFGSSATSNPTFTVYELEEGVKIENRRKYINYTPVEVKSTPLGSVQYEINPILFREEVEQNQDSDRDNDTTRVIKIPVTDADFVNRLKELTSKWVRSVAVPAPEDSALVYYEQFREHFKGLYVESSGIDAVIGMSLSGQSGVFVEYTSDGKTYQRQFSFFSALSFNQIQGNWRGTPIDAAFHQGSPILDSDPGDRYVQAGTGILTMLDFSGFYDFAAEQGDKPILFNSAQLIINGVETTEASRTYTPPPSALGMMVLDENYERWKEVPNQEGPEWNRYLGVLARDYTYYANFQDVGSVVADNNFTLFGASDARTAIALSFDSSKGTYSGFITLLLQRMYNNKNLPRKINNFALYPASGTLQGFGGKSLNTVVFPSDQITLRLYYTEPTISND